MVLVALDGGINEFKLACSLWKKIIPGASISRDAPGVIDQEISTGSFAAPG